MMKLNNIFWKAVVYFLIILIASFVALMLAEAILNKNEIKKDIYLKKIDPEPYVATTNAQGFRVQSADVIYDKKKNGYFRVICLGDSFTYGYGVADDETYPVFLERHLGNISQKKVQVINAGVCGATITEERDMYVKSCAQFESDLVLLLFQSDDIVNDFARSMIFETKGWPLDKYLFKSKVYTLLKFDILKQQGNYILNYYNKHKQFIISKYLEQLESLNKAVTSAGSILAVVIFDQGKDEIFGNFCQDKHIPLVDITGEYAEAFDKGGILLVHHHNAAGNNLLGKLIAEKLAKKVSGINNF